MPFRKLLPTPCPHRDQTKFHAGSAAWRTKQAAHGCGEGLVSTKGLSQWQRRGPCAKGFTLVPQPPPQPMPSFDANLAYLFTANPLLERSGAAAASGFKAVELQFPSAHAPSAIKAELARHGLIQLGVNTALGPRDG